MYNVICTVYYIGCLFSYAFDAMGLIDLGNS